MGVLRVRFSQSSERRGVFNYALKVEVVDAMGIPSKIFVYHQSPAGIDGNTFAEFDHIATPVDFQEIPENAASESVPWFRTDKCVIWFRSVSDMNLAKQMFVDDINALQRTYDVLTSENSFTRQTDVNFSKAGVHETDVNADPISEEIKAMKEDIVGKLSKDAMSGVELETNTAEGIRKAVQSIGNILGANIVKSIAIGFIVSACAMGQAFGAGFSGERFGDIDLDENPVVVTNVTFDGLATLTDITNIVDDISTNFVPTLRKEIANASVAGTNYVDSATNEVMSVVESNYATKADATLTERVYSEWNILHTPLTAEQKAAFYAESRDAAVNDYAVTIRENSNTLYVGNFFAAGLSLSSDGLSYAFSAGSPEAGSVWGPRGTTVATRTELQGYQLGSQTDKPLASEAEAEALRDGKLDKSDVVSPSTSATTGQAADAKATGDALEPLLFAQYYPDGSVKSVAEFTAGIKYDAPDAVNRTVSVLPFCNTGAAANDNSNLSGRVVIPPFVDAQGNGYISDDGTRYKVVGVASRSGSSGNENTNLTAIIAPNTVTSIGNNAFITCTSLITVSLPAVASIGHSAFDYCTLLTSVSLPAATNIGNWAFANDWSLASVDFGANLSSVPSLGSSAFDGVPSTCKIIVPDSLYDAWIAAANWSTLYAGGYKFLRHSEWEYARKYELAGYAPLASPAFTGTPTAPTPTAGDDSTKVATTAFVQGEGANKLDSTSAAPAWVSGTAYPADALVTYNGAVYQNTSGTTIQSATTPDTPNSGWTAKKVSDLFQTKKVSGAVSGHLAGFDVNGAVQDSGIQVGVGGDGVPYIILTN